MNERFDNIQGFKPAARICVVGVGGAGNNAVNRMIDDDLSNVDFFVMNTDKQTLATAKVPPQNKLVLGKEATLGLGAGGDPEVGRKAAEESREEIEDRLKGANMVFIASGMGGGTGTGAAPVVAKIAKDSGALTIAIVTRPFTFEGKKRIVNSVEGLNNLKKNVDAIIIVSNDKLLMFGGNKPISEAFQEADRVLAQSVKTVVDLILTPAVINLDFADVKNTLKDAGIALIGYGMGKGPSKANEAATNAISSPLLEANISGARRAICSVTCGPQVSLYEAQECVDRIIDAAGSDLDIKFGVAINENLTDEIFVSVIASDFDKEFDFTAIPPYENDTQTLKQENKSNPIGQNSNVVKPEKNEENDDEEEGILPDFLRKIHS